MSGLYYTSSEPVVAKVRYCKVYLAVDGRLLPIWKQDVLQVVFQVMLRKQEGNCSMLKL